MDTQTPIEQKNNNENNYDPDFRTKVILSACAIMTLFVFIFAVIKLNRVNPSFPIIPVITTGPIARNINEIKKFSSEQEFKNYLDAAAKLNSSYGVSFSRQLSSEALPMAPGTATKNAADGIGGAAAPDRISGTNVQVIGIDEPDIVKTNGKKIYFSGTQQIYYPMMRGVEDQDGIKGNSEKMIAPYPYPVPSPETKIINAFPASDLAIDGKIDKQGDMLLDRNMLIIFPGANYYYGSDREITGYDISNPSLLKKNGT